MKFDLAQLRPELDAYYARLYALTLDELRYASPSSGCYAMHAVQPPKSKRGFRGRGK